MPAIPEHPVQNRPVEGVLWMLAAGLTFVFVNGTVRFLGTDLPAAQSAFIRFAFGVLILLPSLSHVLRGSIPARVWPLVLMRGAVHTLAVVCWFFAMARLPVAEVTAIGFLNPVSVTVGAAIFFGEKLALRRILAILVAVIGALIVLRPGLREIAPGHLAQLLAAVCFGASYLFAKRLTQVLSATAVVALMSLIVTLGLAPFALAVWVPVTLTQWVGLAAIAVVGTLGHYCMTRAFVCAPMAVTQPVTFLQLIWASLLGVFLFAEPLDPYVLLGGGLMIAAISYITWRETVVRRRIVTPPPDAPRV